MANLREALSQMWGLMRHEPTGFVRTKLSDLIAMVRPVRRAGRHDRAHRAGQFGLDEPSAGMVWTAGFSASASRCGWPRCCVGADLLAAVHLDHRAAAARVGQLPQRLRAGLMAAVAFEIFKQVASIYLRSVVTGPAGATFGPVLGLMVFAYITARLILFATAWAATSSETWSPHRSSRPTRRRSKTTDGASRVKPSDLLSAVARFQSNARHHEDGPGHHLRDRSSCRWPGTVPLVRCHMCERSNGSKSVASRSCRCRRRGAGRWALTCRS